MTENDNALMQGIEKIANSKKVKEACEPQVSYHRNIGETEILRVLYAQKLLLDALEQI